MSILSAQIVDQRVTKIATMLRERFENEVGVRGDDQRIKSAAFVFLVVKSFLDLDDDETIDCIVEGGGDFGVDAVYTAPPQDGEFSVTLVQGKYKRNFDGNANFPEGAVKEIITAIKLLFDPSVQISTNERLKQKVEEIRSQIAEGYIPAVRVMLCNNGLKWNASADSLIIASRLGDQVSWQHVGPDDLLSILQAPKPVDDTIQLSGRATVENFDFRRALIGRMAVGQLASLFDRHGDRLLERNIRRYLGLSGNRVNEAVAATLSDPSLRNNFYFYNNGITIVCSQFRYNALQSENWQVQLSGLQIVNGGQTSKTVQQVVKEIGPDAGNAQVLVRIYELSSEDEQIVRNITYATNSQNPVDLRDLRSNDKIQQSLEQAIDALGFAYRRRRGDQANSTKDITSATTAEAVLAVWRNRPHQARFLTTEHFGKLYDIIFTKDLNGAQSVLAVQVLRFAENKRKRPPTGAPDFLPYASRFIAMLMGRYLLNELGLRVEELNHTNFLRAEKAFDVNAEAYFQKAVEAISDALEPLFEHQSRTLQKLSATFRRGDLVSALVGETLKLDPDVFG